MAVAHHLKPGYTDRTRVKIMTVDPASRRVEAVLKDGSMIHIAVWDVPHAFRWPIENEIWIVQRQNGYWMLDHRQQQDKDETTQAITAMSPGHMQLDAAAIFNANGEKFAVEAPPAPAPPKPPALSFYGALVVTRNHSGVHTTKVTL